MKRRRTGGDGDGGGDDGGDEVADVAATAVDAAYPAGRLAAAGRRPAGSRGSPQRDPSLQISGSCPPSGSKCLSLRREWSAWGSRTWCGHLRALRCAAASGWMRSGLSGVPLPPSGLLLPLSP